MGNNYREEYKMYSTPELRKIAASDTTTYSAEAIEAARAELDGRGETPPWNPDPGPQSIAGNSRPALTDLAQQFLDQTRPWVRFLSIMTFIGAALMVLASLGIMAASLTGGLAGMGGNNPFAGAGGVLLGMFYMGLACLYIAPGIFLFRYADSIKTLKAAPTAGALEDVLRHQKSFWRYVGILSVIALGLAVLGIVLAIVIAVIAFSTGGLR